MKIDEILEKAKKKIWLKNCFFWLLVEMIELILVFRFCKA